MSLYTFFFNLQTVSNCKKKEKSASSQWVDHLKQTQTDDLPLPLSTSSGHLALSSITGLLASTNWFFHRGVGCLLREEELAFGLLR